MLKMFCQFYMKFLITARLNLIVPVMMHLELR